MQLDVPAIFPYDPRRDEAARCAGLDAIAPGVTDALRNTMVQAWVTSMLTVGGVTEQIHPMGALAEGSMTGRLGDLASGSGQLGRPMVMELPVGFLVAMRGPRAIDDDFGQFTAVCQSEILNES